MKRVVLWAALLVFNFLGAAVAYSGIQDYITSRTSRNWPTVEGEVVSVEIEKQESRLGLTRNEPTSVGYYARVKYRYAVNNTKYDGDKITADDSGMGDREPAQRLAMEYRAGAPVTVYYNPDAPPEALLQPGKTGGTWSTFIFGVLFMIVPTGLFLFVGGSDLVPLRTRLWWSMKYGSLSNVGDSNELHSHDLDTSGRSAVSHAQTLPEGLDSDAIRETIVRWEPGKQVVFSSGPDSIPVLVLTSMVFGFIGAFVGFFPVSTLIYGWEADWSDQTRVFPILFAVIGGLVLGYQRIHGRKVRTEFDWDSRTLRAYREFSSNWQGAFRDIQCLVVRCAPINGQRRRYRAEIVVDALGRQIPVAHTLGPMRKAIAARQQAMGLAEPLAASLGVSVRLEGWDDDNSR